MRVKISDWIAAYLVELGITHNFTVPGGGAMHLNMSFGHQPGMKNVFVHHEQSAAIAAEGFFRASNQMPLVCCTTGPGGTNTLTGVLGAWLDSIPMLIISGQVRYGTTARAAGVAVRAMGDQEFDITPMVAHMTKYAQMVEEPRMMKYHLDKALYLATHGRPGPVWLDIPLDVQGGLIDSAEFEEFEESELRDTLPPQVNQEQLQDVIRRIQQASRPVLYGGNGLHIADCVDLFRRTADRLGIPVVCAFDATDLYPHDAPLFAGMPGLLGDRAGNWAVQNADLIVSVGCRLSCRQVGYNVKSWAREAFVIMVDIDANELMKPSIHVELPIHADAKDFLTQLIEIIPETFRPHTEWIEKCRDWRRRYPVVTKQHYDGDGPANAYCFLDQISRRASEDQTIVLGNGTVEACLHAIHIKANTRLICNSGAASMGYDLPCAIGACFSLKKNPVVCLTGDGSIQMNLQEFQTIVHHSLPIKIFVVNNGGYHSMRQTEMNLFPELSSVGIGPETGDLSFPDMKKIAAAYGIPYYRASCNANLPMVIEEMLAQESYCICEVFVDTNQKFEPKSATRRLPDGTLISPPLEDLAPFLPREELKEIMLIPMWKE